MQISSIRTRRGRRRSGPEPHAVVDAPRAVPDQVGEHIGESRGGYRLVRLLGVGPRASVYLGHAEVPSGQADAPPGIRDASIAAVKIFHPAAPEASIDAEIEALARCGHPHTLRLLDVASGPDGRPCLVLERLGGGSLSAMVTDRERIGPGEAVTILAPLVAAVEAMHCAGVAHGALRLSSVMFRSSGAPVIVGFGSAALIPAAQSEAALALDPLVEGDREALGTLVRSVLARVPGDDAVLLLESLPAGAGPIDPARLFALADPAPVRLTASAESPTERPAILASRAVATRREHAAVGHRAEAESPWTLSPARRWLAEQARQVRPRFWVLGGAVAASIVAALLFVPQSETPSEAAADPEAITGGAAVETEEKTRDTDAPPAGDERETGAPPPIDVPAPSDNREPSDKPTASDSPAPSDPGPSVNPVLSDDPVAALAALLAERERCIRDLSVLCLDGALQDGSAAMERDASLIRSIHEGGEVPPDATITVGEPTLVERLGDSALVSLGIAEAPPAASDPDDSKPASALMMRGEAGWRIRDYL